MYTYDIDALYATIADDLWKERRRAYATGGDNNIRAKGDGPEKAVREWIASVVGTNYRVTEGHVVRADGRKSKQIDVIIVRNEATATMYGSRQGESELVRAECVAAVGEVKGGWHDRKEVIRSYAQMVQDVEALQEGLLVENRARFGKIQGDASLDELTRPITGRIWLNRCYTFTIALALGKCDLKYLARDIAEEGIEPSDASVLILDEEAGGAISIPCRIKGGRGITGVQCEVKREADEAQIANVWKTLQEDNGGPRVSAGRLLHLFLTDLQLHLSTWAWQFRDPRPYAKLSPSLRHRHPNEMPRDA